MQTVGVEILTLFTDAFPTLLWWQVWFRVNEQLPVGLQKSLPDRQPEVNSAEKLEGEHGNIRALLVN